MGLRGFFDIQVAQHRDFGSQRAGLGFKGEGF